MNISLDVPEYDAVRGLRFEWEDGFEVTVDVDGSEVHLSANQAGLISLARHLLTLAQAAVPSGHHVHLTADQEINSDIDLIIEKNEDLA
ncbi:Imm32 family immunity protein [Kribbella albertanoniae]|uniref:Uncharacterized protein n=1 Tax=Kribbella albertanoniae TaxID=1266829 RepID=A0A4R4Q9Q5_9ACTN|nr:hypothetical protein [Kribbella albertanoniae]TDC31819.1 hypothetical protein E1261_09965 [Kribbella albertanoniae]